MSTAVTVRSTLPGPRGHEVTRLNNQWVWADTDYQPYQDRPCVHCHLPPTAKGHDACIGTIPNVRAACCGHGRVGEMYVSYGSGRAVLHGEEAEGAIREAQRARRRAAVRSGRDVASGMEETG